MAITKKTFIADVEEAIWQERRNVVRFFFGALSERYYHTRWQRRAPRMAELIATPAEKLKTAR